MVIPHSLDRWGFNAKGPVVGEEELSGQVGGASGVRRRICGEAQRTFFALIHPGIPHG